jgi:hypothetical protein
MNSPASSRVVSRRSPTSKPIIASADGDNDIITLASVPGLIILAASLSVRAGTSSASRAGPAGPWPAGPGAGLQSRFLTASR